MPINLDHVGLNTLIQEPVDEIGQNTVGFENFEPILVFKALHYPSFGESKSGLIGESVSTYPTGGWITVAFWMKLDAASSPAAQYIVEADGSSANILIIDVDSANKLQIRLYQNNASHKNIFKTDSALTDADTWNHYIVMFDESDIETVPTVYVNTVLKATSKTDGSRTGAIGAIAATIALMGNDAASTNTELQGSLCNFAFFNKSLSSPERTEIMNTTDLTTTSCASDIIDYWKLGDELTSNNVGDTLSAGVSIIAIQGDDSAGTVLTTPAGIEVVTGPKTTSYVCVNQEVASISSGDYLVALNTHRNGPYGWPIFKQTRIGQNPLTRHQNRNSIFTYVTEVGDIKLLKKDGKLIGSTRELSDIREIIESPVVSNYKPLTLIGSTKAESTRGGMLSKQRIEIKTSFSNETTYFGDEQATRDHGVDLETVENYEDFIDLYLDGGLDSDDSPFDEFEMLRTEQTIFPAPGNMYLNQVRSREEFVNKFWRTDRSDRTQLNVDTGFGITEHSQSMWPLDTLTDHATFGTATIASLQQFPASISLSSNNSVSAHPKNYGILMNLYTILNNGTYMAGTSSYYQYFDENLASAPLYAVSPVHRLTSASINPYGIPKHADMTASYLEGNSFTAGLWYGNAKWEAGTMSGKSPFYDSYKEYSETIRNIGSDFSLVPEFKISDHVESILEKGTDSELYSNPLLSLTGANSYKNDSSKATFFKIYSNSDFLQNFEIIQNDHKGFVDPLTIKIQCKGIKKFLPYEDFYPCQRSVTLSKTFHNSIKDNLKVTFYGNYALGVPNTTQATPNVSNTETELRTFPFLEKLFSPGILYNTIKSGIAVDMPVSSKNWYTGDYYTTEQPDGKTWTMASSSIDLWLTTQFDKRIPFEALLEPDKYLANTRLDHIDYNHKPVSSGSWDGGGDVTNYKLFANNFIAETSDFFLKNKKYTTIASIPEGDPNFGNCEIGKTYMMRIKMNRSITGSKAQLEKNDLAFFPPQDAGQMRENFTMYSRPSAFGIPRMNLGAHSSSSGQSLNSFTFSKWAEFKKSNVLDFSYHTGTFTFDGTADFESIDGDHTFKVDVGKHYKIGNNPAEGYNYPYTPPYYHGEAWADVSFIATKEKHSLSEILNNSSTEFYRYYNQPAPYNTYSG